MDGNKNVIVTDQWSSPASRALYERQWPGEPAVQAAYHEGRQCGGCSYYAPFNADWGLCAHAGSRHWRETVLEHFTCPVHVAEGWGPHSFTAEPQFHCLCGGDAEYWRPLIEAIQRVQDE